MIKLELDTNGLAKILVAGIGVWIAIEFTDLLLYLFVAYIIMSAVHPVISFLNERGMPIWLGALLVFVGAIGALALILAMILPPLIIQSQKFLNEFPMVMQQLVTQLNASGILTNGSLNQYFEGFLQEISKQIASAPVEVVRLGASIFGGVMDVVTITFFVFYMTIERNTVQTVIVALIPSKDKGHLFELVEKVEKRLGSWLRGQLLSMLLIGIITLIGLLIVGIPFSLPLAVLAGLFEIVPVFGPVLSAVPAILIGFSISPAKALTAFFLYILIQQIENAVVVPRVMKHAVGLDPLLVIISLMVGGRLAGPIGMLLAVPTTAVLIIMYKEKAKIQT